MLRWRIAILVAAAIRISYLDRQTLPVAVKAIAHDIPLSNEQFALLQSLFLLSYAFIYAGGGKLADHLGTRRGFTVIMVFWSLACASHAIAASFTMLATSRFLLGMGEGGGFSETPLVFSAGSNGRCNTLLICSSVSVFQKKD
jgi:ACS family hexuronate transporter-like MFS transporter